MVTSLGRLPFLIIGLAAACLITSSSKAQSASPDVAPVYLMGLSDIENGLTAVQCELDVLPVGELRKPEVISRVAREKFGIPARADYQLKNEDVFVLPRAGAGKSGAASATFDITYNGFSSEAQAAFQYAADIWGMLIQSSVPIKIEANWVPLSFGVLGSAGPEVIFAEFGAGEENTWYVPALADALSSEDQDSERTDIVANFSSSFSSWYFGVDGQTPPGTIDFVTVVLHEIGHGLGFMGSMDVGCTESGHGCWGFDGYPGMPIVYDRFAEDGTGGFLIDESAYPNPSATLGTALKSGAVYFGGAMATAGNGGSRPLLYAPDPWDQGSSYSHLDELSFSGGNRNALMTPFLSASAALHDPGPVGCGVFGDIGWTIAGDCGDGAVVPTAPNVPVLVSPVDGARNLQVPVNLDWRAADRATAYDLEVSTTTSFASPHVRLHDLTETSHLLGDLTAESTYYWRVRSTNDSDESAFSPTYSFTTATAPPAVVIAVSPDDGAVGVATSAGFGWSAVTGAQRYQLQISTNNDFATVEWDLQDLTSTQYTATDLLRDVRYFWRVRALNAGGAGEWSAVRSFSTIVSVPEAPGLEWPGHNEVHVKTAATFTWARSSRADTYDLQVASDEGFVRRVIDRERIDSTGFLVSGLKNDTPYFWRVRAENEGGKGLWSTVFSLRTVVAPPAIPVLAEPTHQLQGAPIRLALSWAESARAESYEVQLARTSKFDPIDVDTVVAAGTQLEVSGLSYQDTYYWRVRAVNAGGTSAWSAIRSFKTQISPPADRPVLASPFNGAPGLGLITRLAWNPVVDADRYELQVSIDSTFGGAMIVDSITTVTNATISVPHYDARYFWRVRAGNAGGGGSWSDVYVFYTRTAPPATAPILLMPANAAENLDPEVDVVWGAMEGVDEYDLQVSADSSFQTLLIARNRVRATTFALQGLAHDSTYYWRVRARNDGGSGAWAEAWHFRIEAAPSGVDADRDRSIPNEFVLHQNYPNPFNPQTRIRLEIARAGHVRMSVYDASGRLVDVLLEKAMQPGTYEVEWNAAGRPSGVYLCMMEAGDFRGHVPLILMK